MNDGGVILGIDYSYTSPAVCRLSDSSTHWWVNYKLSGRPYASLPNVTWTVSAATNEVTRFVELANWTVAIVQETLPTKIVLEDYAFMAAGRITQLAENGGVLKAMIHLHCPNVPVQLVAPTQMKKFATGKGTANKDMVWDAFVAQRPDAAAWAAHCHPKAKSITSPCSDIADSYFLAQYGRQH